jgi:hypothetical protein
MSQENVDLIYQANDAFNRRDIDALLAVADAQIEFVPRLLELKGGDPYRGHDGIRSWWRAGSPPSPTSTRRSRRSRPRQRDRCPDAPSRPRHTSGATMEQTAWQVAEWRQKKCVWCTFESEAEALEGRLAWRSESRINRFLRRAPAVARRSSEIRDRRRDPPLLAENTAASE